jgi:hypothetical protein
LISVSSPYLSMGMHPGPIAPIPTKPVPRPLGSSSLFSSPLHSLLYRHPYLTAGGWNFDARGTSFNLLCTYNNDDKATTENCHKTLTKHLWNNSQYFDDKIASLAWKIKYRNAVCTFLNWYLFCFLLTKN